MFEYSGQSKFHVADFEPLKTLKRKHAQSLAVVMMLVEFSNFLVKFRWIFSIIC